MSVMGCLEDGVVQGTRHKMPGTVAEGGVLVREFLRHERIRHMSTGDSVIARAAGAAARLAAHGAYGQGLMQTTTNYPHDERPPRSRPSTEHASAKSGPSARRTPVLPRGWAPLTVDQQRAVLHACDAATSRLTFRLGSLIDVEVDFRVYQLQNESWAGLWVASRCFTDCDGVVSNRDLLGLGADALRAVRIALDFYNSDLQARGEAWRLQAEAPAVPQGDPRRV